MSGIVRRIMFIELDNRNGNSFHRPADFSVVTTEIGSMMEPVGSWFNRHSPDVNQIEVDFEDMMARVDGIGYINLGQEKNIIGDGVHGGVMMPRAGR